MKEKKKIFWNEGLWIHTTRKKGTVKNYIEGSAVESYINPDISYSHISQEDANKKAVKATHRARQKHADYWGSLHRLEPKEQYIRYQSLTWLEKIQLSFNRFFSHL